MTLPSECGPYSTRLVCLFPSVIMDLPLSRRHGPEWGAVSHYLTCFCFIPDLCPSRAKYPLAMVEKMLDVFGSDLGGGFNIGCRFETMLNNSPLGPRAHALNHTTLVGSFHGYAH